MGNKEAQGDVIVNGGEHTFRPILFGTALLCLLAGCGGGGTGPSDTGRVFVRNDSKATVEVTVRGNVTIRVTGPLMFGKPLPYKIM